MKLVKVANHNAAIELHDSVATTGFYQEYENIRSEHEFFNAKHPKMTAEWFVDTDTNTVYSVARFGGQRVLNKLTLHSSLSSGDLTAVRLREDGSLQTLGCVPQGCPIIRRDICQLGRDIYLTS